MLLPKDFTCWPFRSIAKNREANDVIQNIMRILARTGNTWRLMPLSEYVKQRKIDATYHYDDKDAESPYFLDVVKYTTSPEQAMKFSKYWAEKAVTKQIKNGV